MRPSVTFNIQLIYLKMIDDGYMLTDKEVTISYIVYINNNL